MDRNYLNPFHNARLAMALYREKLEQANSWIDIGSDYKRKDNLDNSDVNFKEFQQKVFNIIDELEKFPSDHIHFRHKGERMTKQNYETIARGIRTEVDSVPDIDIYKASSILRAAVSRMCVELKADNPNFNSETFKEAALGKLKDRV